MQGIAMNIKKLHFLRIDPGEEVIHAIEKYAYDQDIKAGTLTLIGAMQNTKVIVPGEVDKVNPIIRDFPIKCEIVGTGNIALKEGKPFAHVHFMRSDDHYYVTGGHLVSGDAIITVEVTIIEADGILERNLNPITHLHALKI